MLRKLVLVLLFGFIGLAAGAQSPDSPPPPPPPQIDFAGSLQELNVTLKDNLDSTACLGVPMQAGGYTVIPVICKGFGFGLGGGVKHSNEGKFQQKADKEKNQHREGMGGGGGGGVRPIALIVISPDGKFALHKLQESFASQVAKEFVPVLQNLIARVFDLKMQQFKLKSQPPAGNPPPPPPGH